METYEKLWNEAVAGFTRGEQQLDPWLEDKSKDARRGVTLTARPSLPVQQRIMEFLLSVSQVCPGQYFYQARELHVTVMSIISGSEHWRKEMERMPACQQIIGEVLQQKRAFNIHFQGITASPGSIMIQGFAQDQTLNDIRDELRESFANNGLGDLLDRRYKIQTAHITAVRFRSPGMDWNRLEPVLQRYREHDFGMTQVNALELIWGDWYASANIVKTLQEYRLPKPDIT